VEDFFWEITGTYEYELIKDNEIWKIASLTLNFIKEKGTRDVLALAGKRASQHPHSYIVNAANLCPSRNDQFARYRRCAKKLILGISTICLRLIFSHALISTKFAYFWTGTN
jgi:hypothetical protein